MLSDSDSFLQIQNPMDLQTRLSEIRIQLSFWKAHIHHSSQLAIVHAKVNKYIQMCLSTECDF